MLKPIRKIGLQRPKQKTPSHESTSRIRISWLQKPKHGNKEVPLTLPSALVMWDIGTKLIFRYFAIFLYKKNALLILIFLQVQSKCPGEMPRWWARSNHVPEDMCNGLVKHIMSSGAKTDFWTREKPKRDSWANYLSVATYSQQVDVYEQELGRNPANQCQI